jgi:hypothetical protein
LGKRFREKGQSKSEGTFVEEKVPGKGTDSEHFVMVPNPVGFIRQVRSEKFRVGNGWCGKRRIGLTRRRFHIEGWMIKLS